MTVETQQEELEAVLGHRFRKPEWLERALTHSSLQPELAAAARPSGHAHPDNEQLEFLGDAVLGMVVTEHLVAAFPEWGEGQLSKSRAKLVSAASLHAAARRLRLGEYLRLGRGEEKTGGRQKPALLADAYEAVVAAIYLDGGLEAARAFVRRSLLEHAIGKEPQRLGQPDHKSWLQELLQGRGLPPAEYRVVSETGPGHCKRFLVEARVAGQALASGSGASKKQAEQAAARQALEKLQAKDGSSGR